MDISTITETQALQFATDARQEIQDGSRPMNDFLFDMGKRIQDGKPMSDRQVDALRKFVVREQEFAARKQQQAADDANAESCPEGSNRLRGEIVSVKWRDSDFGGNYKMVLKDERGFRVWMTVPGRILNMVDEAEDLKGATIEVTATVTPSDDDRVFGFGKQPRDATLVALAGQPQPAPAAPAQPTVVLPSKQERGEVSPAEKREAREQRDAAEKAHDAARTAAGTPTAVSQATLDTLGDEDQVRVDMGNGADPITMAWRVARVVVGTTHNGQPMGTVVGLAKVDTIPF